MDSTLFRYPKINDENIIAELFAHVEFTHPYKSRRAVSELKRGEFLHWQENIAIYLSQYNAILLMWATGAGKTGATIASSERSRLAYRSGIYGTFVDNYMNGLSVGINKTVYLVPSDTIYKQVNNEIISLYASPGTFETSTGPGKGTNRRITSSLKEEGYRIGSYVTFIQAINTKREKLRRSNPDYAIFSAKYVEWLRRKHDNTFIAIDEVHNYVPSRPGFLRYAFGDDSGLSKEEVDYLNKLAPKLVKAGTAGEKLEKESKYSIAQLFKRLFEVLAILKNIKLVLLSATPIINENNPIQIVGILNLLNVVDFTTPEDDPLNISRLFKDNPKLISPEEIVNDAWYEKVRDSARGKISYMAKELKNVNVRYEFTRVFMGKAQALALFLAYLKVYKGEFIGNKSKGEDLQYMMSAIMPDGGTRNEAGRKYYKVTKYIWRQSKAHKVLKRRGEKYQGPAEQEWTFDTLRTPDGEKFKRILENDREFEKYASKYALIYDEIMDQIEETKAKYPGVAHPKTGLGIIYVYVGKVQSVGVYYLAMYLRSKGIKMFNPDFNLYMKIEGDIEINKDAISEDLRFALVESDNMKQMTKQIYMDIASSPDNAKGSYLKVLIGSDILAEGVSIINALKVIITSAPPTSARLDQITGRILRVNAFDQIIKLLRAGGYEGNVDVDIQRLTYDIDLDELWQSVQRWLRTGDDMGLTKLSADIDPNYKERLVDNEEFFEEALMDFGIKDLTKFYDFLGRRAVTRAYRHNLGTRRSYGLMLIEEDRVIPPTEINNTRRTQDIHRTLKEVAFDCKINKMFGGVRSERIECDYIEEVPQYFDAAINIYKASLTARIEEFLVRLFATTHSVQIQEVIRRINETIDVPYGEEIIKVGLTNIVASRKPLYVRDRYWYLKYNAGILYLSQEIDLHQTTNHVAVYLEEKFVAPINQLPPKRGTLGSFNASTNVVAGVLINPASNLADPMSFFKDLDPKLSAEVVETIIAQILTGELNWDRLLELASEQHRKILNNFKKWIHFIPTKPPASYATIHPFNIYDYIGDANLVKTEILAQLDSTPQIIVHNIIPKTERSELNYFIQWLRADGYYRIFENGTWRDADPYETASYNEMLQARAILKIRPFEINEYEIYAISVSNRDAGWLEKYETLRLKFKEPKQVRLSDQRVNNMGRLCDDLTFNEQVDVMVQLEIPMMGDARMVADINKMSIAEIKRKLERKKIALDAYEDDEEQLRIIFSWFFRGAGGAVQKKTRCGWIMADLKKKDLVFELH